MEQVYYNQNAHQHDQFFDKNIDFHGIIDHRWGFS